MLTGFRAGPRVRRVTALLALALLAGAGGAGAAETFKPLVQGEPPPDFTLPDTAGKRVSLSDFRGRVILLTFVSCYTDTCMAPVNAFEALSARLGPARLAAPTVCAEIPDALRQNGYAGLLQRCGAGQTILIDLEQEVSARYRVTGFPTSVLIAPDFTVQEVLQGVAALRDPTLPARIDALAARAAPNAPRP
jgi:peroxiredoxin